MPQATPEDEEFILKHGGLMSTIVECFTYQIGKKEQLMINYGKENSMGSSSKCLNQPIIESQFFAGTVYDFKWLLDSVE